MYLDANNLYGWAMSQPLPIRNFTFLTEDEISSIDFCSIPEDSKTGYIIECDLHYPPELNDSHNDYPLAAENLLVSEDMFSPFCKNFKQKHVDCTKLILDLSKVLMYDFHYNVIMKQYGKAARLLFTDTDSVTYHLTTPMCIEILIRRKINILIPPTTPQIIFYIHG